MHLLYKKLLVLSLPIVLFACGNKSNTEPKIEVGSVVTLIPGAFACKSSSPFSTVVSPTDFVKVNSALKTFPECYPVDGFIVNGEWNVLETSSSAVLVSMKNYVGKYWIASVSVVPTGKVNSLSQAAEVTETERENFNLDRDSLGEAYTADDPWQVVEKIKALRPAKDKYEDKSQYSERSKLIDQSILYGKVRVGGFLAFFIPKPTISYDADKRSANFAIHGTIDLADIDIQDGKWAKFYREKYGRTVYEHDVVSIDDPRTERGYYDYVGSAKIDPDEARAAESDYGILIIGKFLSPYYSESTKLPFDYDEIRAVNYKKLKMSVKAIWLVNIKSGKIYSKNYTLKKIA